MIKFLAVLLGIILCVACSSSRLREEGNLPRAAPGYVRWLEKQSMKNQVPGLLAQVSQTERVWLNSGEGGRFQVLLKAAPTWLEVNAHDRSSKTPLFQRLLPLLGSLASLNIKGLFLGPVGERLDIWLDSGQADDPYGFAAASLTFDAAAGTEEEYAALSSRAEIDDLQLGADLPPAATGAGPDFLLQARSAVGHAGLYAMLAAPKEAWNDLPAASKDWELSALSQDQAARLAEQGILPTRMRRDTFDWTLPTGWAATGPVLGSDGQSRRWLYRFEGTPRRPVLLWQDPFEQARRLYSAAIIRQTGLLGQSLSGIRPGAWFGLEPDTQNGNTPVAAFAPGLEALNDISRQIHRYGGWALQADPLPQDAIEAVLGGPCDFCREDAIFSSLLEAFISGESSRPVAVLRDWQKKNIDLSRLAHGLNVWLLMKDENIRNPLVPAERLKALGSEDKERFRKMFLAWQLGLPGLAFINMQDIMDEENQSPIPATETVSLLGARAKYGAALGKLVSITEHDAALGALFALENNTYWLLASNFSRNEKELAITLPAIPENVFDGHTNEDLRDNLLNEKRKFRMMLDGRQARNVIFEMN